MSFKQVRVTNLELVDELLSYSEVRPVFAKGISLILS